MLFVTSGPYLHIVDNHSAKDKHSPLQMQKPLDRFKAYLTLTFDSKVKLDIHLQTLATIVQNMNILHQNERGVPVSGGKTDFKYIWP